MRIRVATADDANGVAEVRVASWRSGYRGQIPDDVLDALDPVADGERYRGLFGDPTNPFTTLISIADDETVTGFVTFGPYRPGEEPAERDPTSGEILAMYVNPTFWCHGYGGALMAAALRELHAQGRDTVSLWVLRTNERARRFYERSGFVPDGTASIFRIERGTDPPVDLDEIRYVLRGGSA